MENKAAELVSNSLLGLDFKTVIIAGKAYSIQRHAIKVNLRAIRHFSRVEINESSKLYGEILPTMSKNTMPIIKGIAAYIVGDVKYWQFKAKIVERRLLKCNWDDILKIKDECISLMGIDSFFHCAVSAKKAAGTAATPR